MHKRAALATVGPQVALVANTSQERVALATVGHIARATVIQEYSQPIIEIATARHV